MATTVTLNGVGYDIPALGEDGWGDDVSGYLIASATGLLSKAGGTFTLTADVDFGATYGIKSNYIKSRSSNIATTGQVRLANADTGIVWRNAANAADLALTVNASNALVFNGANVLSAGAASIVNADVSASASIDLSKLAALIISRALVSDGSGVISVATTTATQIGYLSAATGTTGTTSTNLVFSTSPTLVTPVLGVASATSINKVTITAPASSSTLTIADGSSLITAGAFSITLTSTATTAVTLPTSGTLVSSADTGTVTSTMIANGTIVNADINASAAIDFSKLATLASGNLLVGSAGGVATSVAVTGDVTISSAGVTAIASGVIVNADVNASAAIAGTKISPDFGSQNIATTGTATVTATVAYIATLTGSNTATDASFIKFQRQRSGGAIVASADTLGTLQWDGWNGSAYVNAAAITAEVGGTPGVSNDMPGDISFWSTPDGSGTLRRMGKSRATGSWFIGPTAADQASFRGNDVRGVNDGTAAVAGFVGEVISLSSSTPASFTTSTQWLEVAAGALALTAGAWSISAAAYFQANGATVIYTQMCIGTATGNNSTGSTLGVNITSDSGPAATFDKSTSIPAYTVNISSPTNYYLKFRASYSVSTPNYAYQITAVRIR